MDPYDNQEYDSQELKRLLASDLQASFRLLVKCYQHILYNYVRYMLHHQQDAEDLVQEVFFRAYMALYTFSRAQWDELDLRPWLFTIARNLCLNHLNRVRSHQSKLISIDQPQGVEAVERMEFKHHPSPEGEMEDRETLEEVSKCIRRLAEKLRTPVILHYVIGLPYQEIAIILDQPENTVKSNGRRGFNALLAMMKEEVK